MDKSHFKHWLNADCTQAFLAGLIISTAFSIGNWVNRTHFKGLATPSIKFLVSLFIIIAAGSFVIAILKKIGTGNSQATKLHQYIFFFLCLLGGYFFVPLIILFWAIISMVIRLFF